MAAASVAGDRSSNVNKEVGHLAHLGRVELFGIMNYCMKFEGKFEILSLPHFDWNIFRMRYCVTIFYIHVLRYLMTNSTLRTSDIIIS